MLYSIGLIFVMHQHELSIGMHMSSPSWTSFWPPTLSHPSRLLQSIGYSFLSQIASSHVLSILHMVVYTCTLKKKTLKAKKLKKRLPTNSVYVETVEIWINSIVQYCVSVLISYFENVPWLCKMFIGESEVKVNRLYHFCNFLWSYIISKCNITNWRKLCTNP